MCITYAASRADTGEGSPARFGYIVSKAVGNAVTRNLIRRRMKSVSEELIRDGVTDIDIVFRAFPAAAGASFDELERELRRAVTRVIERV